VRLLEDMLSARLAGVCYLWTLRGMQVVGSGVMVGQLICRRWSLTGLINLQWKKRRIGWSIVDDGGSIAWCG
jgi:hypothetical protein